MIRIGVDDFIVDLNCLIIRQTGSLSKHVKNRIAVYAVVYTYVDM